MYVKINVLYVHCTAYILNIYTVAQCKAHCSQFEHFGDSLRTPVAPLMSPSPGLLVSRGC